MYAFDDEKRSSKIARFFECFFFFFFFTYEISLRLFIHINVSLTFLFLKRNKKMDRLCGYTNKIRLYNCVFLCFCGNSSKRRIIFLFNTTSSPKPFLKEFLNFCQSSFLPSIFHSIFYRFTDWNGKSIQAWKGGDFLFSFQQDFGESIVYIGKDSINLKKNHTHRRRFVIVISVPSGTNRLFVNPL